MRARGRRRVDHIRLDLTLGVGGAQLRGRRPPCVMSAARARECERGTARAPARRARTRFEESCRQSSRTELELQRIYGFASFANRARNWTFLSRYYLK